MTTATEKYNDLTSPGTDEETHEEFRKRVEGLWPWTRKKIEALRGREIVVTTVWRKGRNFKQARQCRQIPVHLVLHFAATGVLVLTSHTGDAGKIGEEWRYRLKDEVEMIVSPDWEI